jgi:hypothetical protein
LGGVRANGKNEIRRSGRKLTNAQLPMTRRSLRSAAILSRILAAVLGPIPGSNCKIRNPATRSRGLSHHRSTLTTSFTCAASRNLRPPYFTNGILRRASSISSWALWCDAQNSTACCFKGTPASRAFRMRCATYRACAASSATVVKYGFCCDLFSPFACLSSF